MSENATEDTGPVVENHVGHSPFGLGNVGVVGSTITPAAAMQPTPFPVDSLERKWDAAKFRVNKDGTPRLDTLGRFIPLRGGRNHKDGTPAGTKPADTGPAPDFSDVEKAARAAVEDNGPTDPAKITENATAETIIGAIQTALVMIGNDEGILSAQEKELLRRPLVRVLQKYDVGPDSLPAEADLALAIAVVVINRLKKPKTAAFMVRVKGWWLARKIRQATGPAVAVSGS